MTNHDYPGAEAFPKKTPFPVSDELLFGGSSARSVSSSVVFLGDFFRCGKRQGGGNPWGKSMGKNTKNEQTHENPWGKPSLEILDTVIICYLLPLGIANRILPVENIWRFIINSPRV